MRSEPQPGAGGGTAVEDRPTIGGDRGAKRIAYLVNQYPKPSHSFIRREIRALERRGLPVHRFAIRNDRAGLVDPADLEEQAITEGVLARGAGPIAAAVLGLAVRAPGRLARAARLAIATGWRSERGWLRHLVYLAEACYVARRSEALGIDHIHAHFGTNSAAVAMLSRAVGGPPYSFTVHGPEEFDKPDAISLGEKIARAEFTVAISAFGRSQLCRWTPHGGWPRLHVVHCGIEPVRFADPVPLPLREGGVRLVCIGRLVEQKGQLLLIDALAAAQAEPAPHLSLVGDGEMRPEIEAAIARHGLGDRVTITGWVDEGRVRAELDAAHALVVPSFAEGLPMVVMEAMAAARPVIATAIAGIPELVRPGETGWIVPAGDPEAFAEAIDAVAATGEERLAEMGRAGRDRVLERHDIDREAERLARLFEAAAAPRRTAGDVGP